MGLIDIDGLPSAAAAAVRWYHQLSQCAAAAAAATARITSHHITAHSHSHSLHQHKHHSKAAAVRIVSLCFALPPRDAAPIGSRCCV